MPFLFGLGVRLQYRCQDRQGQSGLIVLRVQQRRLLPVGQEPALHQDGGELRFFQQVHAAARRLYFLGTVIDRFVQRGLDRFRQLLTSRGLTVEYLCAMDAGHLGQTVLMETHQYAAGNIVDLGHPVLQIGVLPLPDGGSDEILGKGGFGDFRVESFRSSIFIFLFKK